jgi:hypothetical protein
MLLYHIVRAAPMLVDAATPAARNAGRPAALAIVPALPPSAIRKATSLCFVAFCVSRSVENRLSLLDFRSLESGVIL